MVQKEIDWDLGGWRNRALLVNLVPGEEDRAQSSHAHATKKKEYDGRKRRMELPCPGDRTRPDVALLLH